MANYYYLSCVWPTIVRRSSKSSWSSICHTADLVFSRTQHCVVMGDNISFCKDPWHDCGILFCDFPRLFRLFCTLNISVVEARLLILRLGTCTLDVILLIMKFMNGYLCMLFLSSSRFRMVSDSWSWTIDSSSMFTMKSMIDDLTGVLEPFERDFYSIIWMDHFPKKIKIFLWELSHEAINTTDHLQHCMPYMSLSLSWCIMCCANAKSHAHLFIHCPFARQFWDHILEAFGWSTALSNDILDIFNSLMVGHPFIGCSKVIWFTVLWDFFWTFWGELNRRPFHLLVLF